jgi:hypothetical protein
MMLDADAILKLLDEEYVRRLNDRNKSKPGSEEQTWFSGQLSLLKTLRDKVVKLSK